MSPPAAAAVDMAGELEIGIGKNEKRDLG